MFEILLALVMASSDPALDEIGTYSRESWDRTPTECDALAAHPDDPESVAEGVTRAQMDLDNAISACHEAVAADPDNPRLNYQLARAYGYSGRHAEGEAYRLSALRAGYPQSLFVVGYIRLTGWDGRAPNPCYGGALIRKSAQAGRFAGLVGFPHYAVEGYFDDCDDLSVEHDELNTFLDQAAAAGPDFYQSALIMNLRARLNTGTTHDD